MTQRIALEDNMLKVSRYCFLFSVVGCLLLAQPLMAEEGIKDQNPNISPEDLKVKLQERIYGFSFPFKNSKKKIN